MYGVEKYLPACIDSLINQTLQEIEIILINDASPDNSIDIMHSYEAKYPEKIIVIDSKENLRQGGARNLGIRKARGEFIGFTDSDDMVNHNMFRILVEKIRETGADYVCAQYTRINEDTTYSEAEKFTKPFTVWTNSLKALSGTELSDEGRNRLIISEVGSFCARLFRREWFLQNGFFFPEHLRYEDNYLGSMIESHVRKFYLIEEILYYYRNNPTSTVNAKGNYHLDRIAIEEKLVTDMKAKGQFERYYDALEYICIFRYFVNTFHQVMAKVRPIPWDAVNHIKNFMKENYPDFLKNKYLREQNWRYRFWLRVSYYSPRVFVYLFPAYRVVVKVIKKLIGRE